MQVACTKFLQGINPNSQPVRNKKKKKKWRKHTLKKKQSYAQDNIYVVQQFAYVHRVAGISLLSGKNTEYKMRLQYFSLTLKHGNTTHNKTLITQSRFLYKNGPKFFSQGRCPRTPKRLVHERSDLGLSAQAFAPWTKLQ